MFASYDAKSMLFIGGGARLGGDARPLLYYRGGYAQLEH